VDLARLPQSDISQARDIRPEFAKVPGMPDEYVDPSGNTDQFRAFVQSPTPEPAPAKTRLYLGLAVAAVVVIVIVGYLVMR
jgi:hypothetical protein